MLSSVSNLSPGVANRQRSLVPGALSAAGLLVGLICGYFVLSSRSSGTASIRKYAPSTAGLLVVDSRVEIGLSHSGQSCIVKVPVTNCGHSRLVVNWENEGCGCCESEDRTLLVPAGTTRLMTFPFRVPDKPGPFEDVAQFTTNDPRSATFRVVVTGTVLSAEPMSGN